MVEEESRQPKNFLNFDFFLGFLLVGTLLFHLLKISLFWNESVLVTISIIATSTVFFSAIKSLKNRKISIDLLASVALFVSLFEKEWLAVIFINLMIVSARIFIDYVKIKSHSALQGLMKLKPKKARIIKDGKTTEIPLGDVRKGNSIVVKLGEMIPVDGIIEKGEATIDQSSLTGESLPVFKKEGDRILSFTTIIAGHLIIKTEKVGNETTFEKIVALVEQSQVNKAPIYTLIDKFAKWYIFFTFTGSLLVYLFSRDMNLVAGVLLVSCADDIAIATPLALMSAIIHSAKHGAIIKGGNYLEGLAKIKMIIFDKTGTLTQGKLKVEEIFCFNQKTKDEVLKLAAIPSSCSSHPIAKTIVNYAKEKNFSIDESENFEEYGGKGMSSVYKSKQIAIGKPSFLKDLGIKITLEQHSEVKKATLKKLNVTLVAYDRKLVGFIALVDELRPRAKDTMEELRKLGIEKTVMLTGDNEHIAQKVAEEIGIDIFHANLLPKDKLEYYKKYSNKKYKVAMVGDGVNDAPVLALADIGIAMGAIGSDSAIEAADIAMMKDDISQIPELIKIGRATIKVIRQNLLLWGILNILGFTLVFLHILNPPGAAVYNFLTDFIPIFNSLRLFR
ncbi:MAG: cation-translocating P-type ATPase [Candidatus Nealsonbacteria bacterium]|nr:cation-translocating P-type ATPase [Candidatus Nealsonbacteria bacterium]